MVIHFIEISGNRNSICTNDKDYYTRDIILANPSVSDVKLDKSGATFGGHLSEMMSENEGLYPVQDKARRLNVVTYLIRRGVLLEQLEMSKERAASLANPFEVLVV